LVEPWEVDLMQFDLNKIGEFLERVVDSDAKPGEKRRSALESICLRWRQIGLKPGDLVILALPSAADALDHFFAAYLASLVPMIVSSATPSLRLCELAKGLGARAIVSGRKDVPYVAVNRAEPLETATGLILTVDTPSRTTAGEIVLQTSGTSGIGSACVFDLETSLVNASLHWHSIGQRRDDIGLISLPLHFSFALVAQALAAFNCGSSIIIQAQPFHVESFLDSIRHHRVTIASLTPVQIRMLLAQLKMWPDGLRVLTVGGDVIPTQSVEALLCLKGSRELYLTYGLTQAGPRVSTLAAHSASAKQLRSVGRPLPGISVSLRQMSCDAQSGELLVASPTLMKRRIGQIDYASQEVARSSAVATGDIFRIDEAGYLYFEGRCSDFVIINGNKVHLGSIRRIAVACPGVLAAKTKLLGSTEQPTETASGYDLFLFVNSDTERVRTDLHSRFRKWLRPNELPRHTHISQSLDGTAYKQ
jgi:long-chain acyl-CoA synthetase